MPLHRHRTGARTSAAVRSGKCFVQIQMHDVGAEIARTRDANQRVHVGAIHVELRALGVQDFRDARYLFFEHAQRIGICQHQRGDIFVDCARQFADIDHAQRVGLDVFDSIAGHVARSLGWCHARNRESAASCADGLAIRAAPAPSGCR